MTKPGSNRRTAAIVRKLLGYCRFEGIAAAQALIRLFVNFFQPLVQIG
jgi:hypothetical protein